MPTVEIPLKHGFKQCNMWCILFIGQICIKNRKTSMKIQENSYLCGIEKEFMSDFAYVHEALS